MTSRAWESASHRIMLNSAPKKKSSRPLTARQQRCARSTARLPMTSTASTTILRTMRMAQSSALFCRSGPCRASTRARISGSALAASESYLLDSMTFARSSRATVRYPTWIATTTSRPRRPLACSAQGSIACRGHELFSLGATSSLTGAASSLACSQSPAACATRAGGDSDPNF